MIFCCTKLCLSKCNSSWVIFIKQNMNFNFKLLKMFIFLSFSQKNGLNKSFLSFEVQVLQAPQKFEHPPFWNGLSYGVKSITLRLFLMAWPTKWISQKNTNCFKFIKGGHTGRLMDRQHNDLISLTFLFEESRLKTMKIVCNKIPTKSRWISHFVHVHEVFHVLCANIVYKLSCTLIKLLFPTKEAIILCHFIFF
jgi:hypothetical protein